MTNSITTTVVEVTKNIHDTVIMASCQSQINLILCQVVMTKTLTGYDVMVCHNNNVIFALKMSLLSERHLMTVVINMHKPYFIFKTYVLCTNLQVKCYPFL